MFCFKITVHTFMVAILNARLHEKNNYIYFFFSGLFQQSLPPRGGRHFKEILMGVGCP